MKLAAVCVDPVETSQALAERLRLGFPIVADPSGDTIRAYGCWHAEKQISLPAVFVIDGEGVVRWKKISTTVTDRPSEDEVLSVVGSMSGSAHRE